MCGLGTRCVCRHMDGMALASQRLDICVATHCNTLQHTATHWNVFGEVKARHMCCITLQHTATHCNLFGETKARHMCCNTLQHTATCLASQRRNICVRQANDSSTLHHCVTHFNTLQYAATRCNTLQHTATHCTTLHHTAPHCTTLQHEFADSMAHCYCSNRAFFSA